MAKVCVINTTSESDEVMMGHLFENGIIDEYDEVTIIDQSDLHISDNSAPSEVIGAVDGLLNAAAPLNSDPIFARFEDGELVSWSRNADDYGDEPDAADDVEAGFGSIDPSYWDRIHNLSRVISGDPSADVADAKALHDESMQLKQKMEQARSTRSSIRRSLPMRYDLFDAFATHTIETINWFGYEPMDAPDELDGDHELYVKPHGNGVFAYVDINEGQIDAFLIRPMVFGNGGMQVNVSDLQSTMQVAGRELINLFDSIRPFGTANVSGKDVLISPLA